MPRGRDPLLEDVLEDRDRERPVLGDGGVRGLCAEGRWELALDAVRELDVKGLLAL